MRVLGGIWVLCVCVLVLSCAGSSGTNSNGGGAGSNSSGSIAGISFGTQLSATTATQRVALCQAHMADIQTIGTNSCVATAGIGQASQMVCQQMSDACAAKVAVNCNTTLGDLTGCTVTVGQFESCFPMVLAWSKSLSCANFDKSPPSLPDCFGMLDSACPGALEMITMPKQ